MVKRYALFSGYHYYPNGGWEDFKGFFESVEDAAASLVGKRADWWHVVHIATGEVVKTHIDD